MKYIPVITRTWFARQGKFVWIVKNEPPRRGWGGSGGIDREDHLKHARAWAWCHERNKSE